MKCRIKRLKVLKFQENTFSLHLVYSANCHQIIFLFQKTLLHARATQRIKIAENFDVIVEKNDRQKRFILSYVLVWELKSFKSSGMSNLYHSMNKYVHWKELFLKSTIKLLFSYWSLSFQIHLCFQISYFIWKRDKCTYFSEVYT